MKPVTDAQVRRLMEEMSKSGKVGQAAMKAGMDRKTGRRYIAAGKLPSEMRQPRWWRTRQDAFAEDWPAVAKLLEETPGLEAQTVLELLEVKQPGRYNESHLRTLQRKPLTGRVIAARPRMREIGVDGNEPAKTRRAWTSRQERPPARKSVRRAAIGLGSRPSLRG